MIRLARALRVAAASLTVVAAGLAACGPARAIVYHGPPDLGLAARLVQAGSGEQGYRSKLLFARLYGADAPHEQQLLVQRYGARHVAQFFPMLDYSVYDIVRLATTVAHAKIPAASAQQNPAALQRDLIRAGTVPDGRYDVGYMLERMMTHPLHHLLMQDLDAVYGPKDNGTFHEMLASVVTGRIQAGGATPHMRH